MNSIVDVLLTSVYLFVAVLLGVFFLYVTVYYLACAWYSGRLAAIRKAFHLSGRKKNNGQE